MIGPAALPAGEAACTDPPTAAAIHAAAHTPHLIATPPPRSAPGRLESRGGGAKRGVQVKRYAWPNTLSLVWS